MKRIKYLVMDVDGTLTDGKIYMGSRGELFKAFDVKDGYGIHDILPRADIVSVIITGRESEIVRQRCRELEIQKLYQGVSQKETVLEELLSQNGDSLNTVAFIGDDINDLSCMETVKNGGGLIGCPADAVKEIKELVDFVCANNGGQGAVREFVEWILHTQHSN